MSQLTSQAGQLFTQLKEQLALTAQLPQSLLTRTATAITHCQNALQKLKEMVTAIPFSGPGEEIDFFKTIKPPFMAELFFYTRIYQLHLRWPVCSTQMQQEYLRNALLQVQQFFDENREFYIYCRSGHTDRHEQYFMRQHPHTPILPPGIYFASTDPFTTGYDLLLAHLLVNDQLKEYLEEQLDSLALEMLPPFHHNDSRPLLKWTDDIIGLVELAYTLVEKGCCNDGKATLVQVIAALGKAFNTDLKGYRRYWIDIRRRKTGKPSFMEKLLQYFKRRLDRPDY